jgi:aspartyl/glutamyl-tRNA(Asn/Gln) amidotransferase C subunit
MTNFSKEELLKLSNLSSLHLDDKEISLYIKQLKVVIDYIDVLQQVEISPETECVRNRNVFRDDVVKDSYSEKILSQAPKKKGQYFVVPKILN